MTQLTDKISRAFDLWQEITGIDPDAKRYSFSDYDMIRCTQQMQELLTEDDSYLTTLMMLDYFLRQYASQKTFTFTLKDFMASRDKVDAIMSSVAGYMEKTNELFAIVQADDVQSYAAQFQNGVLAGLKLYGANEKAIELASDMDNLAFLRRDAIQSIKGLHPHQFLKGEFSTSKPKFVDRIHMFWNIDSLLVATRDMQQDGVSLNLIRDPKNPKFSYFVFAIKNGQNVSILTDKTNWVHPMQKNMTRTDRHFISQLSKNHFPYGLIPHEVSEDEKTVYFTKMEGLIPLNAEAIPLKYIRDLEPHEVVWASMMLSLIADKFFKNEWQAKELSYTLGMVEVKDKLVIARDGTKLPVATTYQPITLEKLDLEDISLSEIEKQVRPPTKHNKWMEDRYTSKVNVDSINVWDTDKALLLGKSSGQVTVKEYSEIDSWGHSRQLDQYYQLQGMDPTEFGSEEELRRNQVWVGRHNLATSIQREADNEFETRKKEIIKWYEDAVKKNLPNLLAYVKEGTISADALRMHEGPTDFGSAFDRVVRKTEMLYYGDINSSRFGYVWDSLNDGNVMFGGYDHDVYPHYRCHFTGAAASHRARFTPQSHHGLALLAGCKVDELPDVIQQWWTDEPYGGNHILDRCDPMDFHLKNPWKKIRFVVNIYVSKRSHNKIMKGDSPFVE